MKLNDLNTSMRNAVTAATGNSVPIGAVLCWSEYYNGKWQPTKTSDVNAPTVIGAYAPSGPGSFETIRNGVRIVPAQFTRTNPNVEAFGIQFSLPSSALLLAITVGDPVYPSGGFLLHNTHSLPVRFDDIAAPGFIFLSGGTPVPTGVFPLALFLDIPSPSRSFPPALPYTGGYGDGTFSISYALSRGAPATVANNILQYNWAPRWVDSQPGLKDHAWDAPFIYEDRRYLFYVTTTIVPVRSGIYNGYGIPSAATMPDSAQAITPLVLRQQVVTPTPDEILAFNGAGGDPVAVQRYLSQQPNIKAGLATPATVSYQGQVISPAGSPSALNLTAGSDGQGA